MYNASYQLLLATYVLVQASTVRISVVRLGWRDNLHPRQTLDKMEATGKFDKEVMKGLRRRQAAHENGFEGLSIFAASVVAGNMAGLSGSYMTTSSALYLAFRALYVWLYVKTTDQNLSLIRTVVWYLSNACIFTTLLKAGSKINA